MDWESFNRGVFLVNVLGVVYHNGKILIGRRENDPHIDKLAWSLPGGRPGYDGDMVEYLKKEIKKKTNIDVEVKEVLFARTYPGHREFLSIYYFCEYAAGELKAGEKFVEAKWVLPSEVKEYFKYPLPDEKLIAFIESLEK